MYFRVFVLEKEPQHVTKNNFILKDTVSGIFYDFSFDNDFCKLIRMMAGANTDLRTSIPPLYSDRIKYILSVLIVQRIFPVSLHSDIEYLCQFCNDSERRSVFLNRMSKEICCR